MSKSQIRGTRLSGVLLFALALPLALSAQSPADDAMAEDTTADAGEVAADDMGMAPADEGIADEGMADESLADDGMSGEAPADGAPAASDPSVLDAEMMPRASRSLLLDAVRTNAGYFVVGERGHVLNSEDGKTWHQVAIPTRSTLTTIASVDGILWAAGHDGVIIHSTDGGQSWVRRRAAPWSPDTFDASEGVPVMDLLFTDAQHGFAIGAYSLMLVTEDGGVTWEPRGLDLAGDEPAAEAAPAAASDADDWTFNAADLELDAESDPHLNAIARAGSGALVIAGERGTFLRSRDGGDTWESKRLPYEGSMFGVLAWEGEHILVYGLRGNVYESRNLGTTWTRVETGVTTSLMGGTALPGGGAVLVGANGALLSRPDADSPFTAKAFETANGETPLLSAVIPAGDSGFLVVGDKGADLTGPQ